MLASNAREDYFEDLDSVKKPKHIEKTEAGHANKVSEEDDSSEITSS